MTPAFAERARLADSGRARPLSMMACLILSDSLALLLSVGLGLGFRIATGLDVDFFVYLRLAPFLFVFLLTYAAIGLYSGVSLGPAEELRRTTISSGLLFLTLAAATVGIRGANSAITTRLIISLLFSIALVPLFRASVRRWLGAKGWWGYPAVIFGAGGAAGRVAESLERNPELGLRPIAMLDDNGQDGPPSRLPVVSGDGLLNRVLPSHKDAYAVVVMSGAPHQSLSRMVEEYAPLFSHVLLVPDLPGFSTKWMGTKTVAGLWTIEVRRQGLSPRDQYAKRILDIVACLLAAPFVVPLLLVLAACVKAGSPGPVFYGQKRIGRNGRSFIAWKFRTMVVDSDAALARHLKANPEARREWEENHKLRDDPRVTAVGRFLRKSSLDELPQLWNVVKGEMSLVGPRPIVEAEVARYGASFDLYTQIPGGITGLWQVSGRNNTTYQERVMLDEHYVRNWSLWLDLCILFQTFEAVLFRRGAY